MRAVARREADLVALQEVRTGTVTEWRESLRAGGLEHVIDSGELAGKSIHCFNLIASRWPLEELAPLENPEPPEQFLAEGHIAARVRRPGGRDLEIHNVHIPPGSSRGLTKVRTLEALYLRLARESEIPRILCGDLNTPQYEGADGEVWSFADHHEVSLRPRWNSAELSVLLGLAAWDLPDVFRSIHGYGGEQEGSWGIRRSGNGPARRFDHAFASESLGARDCEYIHGWREQNLSDHSALEVLFS